MQFIFNFPKRSSCTNMIPRRNKSISIIQYRLVKETLSKNVLQTPFNFTPRLEPPKSFILEIFALIFLSNMPYVNKTVLKSEISHTAMPVFHTLILTPYFKLFSNIKIQIFTIFIDYKLFSNQHINILLLQRLNIDYQHIKSN